MDSCFSLPGGLVLLPHRACCISQTACQIGFTMDAVTPAAAEVAVPLAVVVDVEVAGRAKGGGASCLVPDVDSVTTAACGGGGCGGSSDQETQTEFPHMPPYPGGVKDAEGAESWKPNDEEKGETGKCLGCCIELLADAVLATLVIAYVLISGLLLAQDPAVWVMVVVMSAINLIVQAAIWRTASPCGGGGGGGCCCGRTMRYALTIWVLAFFVLILLSVLTDSDYPIIAVVVILYLIPIVVLAGWILFCRARHEEEQTTELPSPLHDVEEGS
jgi:hypothetical protein